MKRHRDLGVTGSNIEPSCRPFNQSQLNKPSKVIERLRKERQTMKGKIKEWTEEVFWVRLVAYNSMRPWKMPHTTTWLPLFYSHNPSPSFGSWDWCYWPKHYGVVKIIVLIWFGDRLNASKRIWQYTSLSDIFSKWQPLGPQAFAPSHYYLSFRYCPFPFSTALKISRLPYSCSQLVFGWEGVNCCVLGIQEGSQRTRIREVTGVRQQISLDLV